MQEILLNIESKEIRCAHLKNGQVNGLILERKQTRQITGNIYLGRVTNILENIQSAFIDINEGENGFIHISDIIENTKKFEELFDMDFDLDHSSDEDSEGKTKSEEKSQNIEQILKKDQPVLVQVVKEPIGTKGARLTSNISLAGRYLVLLPNNPHRGVSRKIEDRSDRDRLKKLISAFEMPQDMGLICRTASCHASMEMLVDEANELLNAWKAIIDKFNKAKGPTLLYEESDLIKKSVMNAVEKKYSRLLIDHYGTYQKCKRLYQPYMQEHPLKIEFYRDKTPIFERFGVERELGRALRRKIWLNCGGYLFFDRTEAMYTVDVNSGRSTKNNDSKDVEESLVRINLEAAEEIARQLRLRNIGGLIICDFIDMRSRKNQRRVLEKLKESMKEDSAKCTVLNMSEFGLVEMTRQRSRESLAQTMYTACPYCGGNGMIKNHESMAIEIERNLKKVIHTQNQYALRLITHPELTKHLEVHDKSYLTKLAHKNNARLEFKSDDNFHLNEFQFYSTVNEEKIEC